FQAEDGIRDATVTGVQTCALPISIPAAGLLSGCAIALLAPDIPRALAVGVLIASEFGSLYACRTAAPLALGVLVSVAFLAGGVQIGRASCRECARLSVLGCCVYRG